MSYRRVGFLVLVAALAPLGVAYWAQDFQHLVPCPLCLWERWPYRVAAVLGVLAMVLRPAGARVVLGLAVAGMLVGAGIGFLHVGVEMHWWKSPLPECNAFFDAAAPLPAVPAPPCDDPTYLVPAVPVSMAMMDLLYEVAFAFAVLPYVLRKPRRFI